MNSKTVRAASEIFAALVFSILWSSLALALDIPKLHGRVTDLASMLRPSTVQQLETNLAALEQSDSTQIAVLTIPSLEGDSLEDFSLHVVEKWRLGQKNLDNGALLLISKGDRKIRIEVGYGLEGVLTDLVSGRIIRDIITPQFRNGNFDQGVIDGIAAMSSAVKGEFKASEQLSAHSGEGDFNGFLGAFLFFLFVVGRIFRKRKLAAGIGGALVAPLLSYVFMGFDPARLLFFSFFGFVAGIIASAILTGAGATGVRGIRRSSRGSFGGGFGGGFGGSSGGFSGGGGGFGGGGASGGW